LYDPAGALTPNWMVNVLAFGVPSFKSAMRRPSSHWLYEYPPAALMTARKRLGEPAGVSELTCPTVAVPLFDVCHWSTGKKLSAVLVAAPFSCDTIIAPLMM